MLEQIAAQQAVVENLSGEELRRKKGSLVRDYNHCQDRRQKQKERLTSLLNQMVASSSIPFWVVSSRKSRRRI